MIGFAMPTFFFGWEMLLAVFADFFTLVAVMAFFCSTSSRLQCRTKTKLAFVEPYVFSSPSRPPSEAYILSRRTKHILD
jgi:hypothetical protein